jgi:type IX secretion system PorP/SprF family membrane protein
MSKTKFIALMLIMSVFIVKAGFSQDAEFSQFYANPLYLNPSLTGSTDCGRFNLNYRNQWPSLNKAFITYNASYDQNIPSLSSGLGVSVIGDNNGNNVISTNIISGFYSYKLQLSKSILVSAGFQASFYQKKLDWNNLIFGDQIDPGSGDINPVSNETPPGSLNKSFVDFSTGITLGYLDKFFAGVGVHHLTQPENGFYDNSNSVLSMKITVHGGAIINLTDGTIGGANSEDIVLRPNILYQQQGKFHQMNLGAYLSKYPFVGGLWFRHNFENADAAIVLLGFQHNRYRIGYSYDFSLSKLSGNSGGAHEISFAWEFCVYKGEKRRHIKAIKAPTF